MAPLARSSEIVATLDFEGRTPRSDEGLENLAVAMARCLPAVEPIEGPGPVDPAGWADYLRQPLAQASGLLSEIDHHSGERSLSVETKARAMRLYEVLFRRINRVGWILCNVAVCERMPSTRSTKAGGRE